VEREKPSAGWRLQRLQQSLPVGCVVEAPYKGSIIWFQGVVLSHRRCREDEATSEAEKRGRASRAGREQLREWQQAREKKQQQHEDHMFGMLQLVKERAIRLETSEASRVKRQAKELAELIRAQQRRRDRRSGNRASSTTKKYARDKRKVGVEDGAGRKDRQKEEGEVDDEVVADDDHTVRQTEEDRWEVNKLREEHQQGVSRRQSELARLKAEIQRLRLVRRRRKRRKRRLKGREEAQSNAQGASALPGVGEGSSCLSGDFFGALSASDIRCWNAAQDLRVVVVGMDVVVACTHKGKWNPYVGTVVKVPTMPVPMPMPGRGGGEGQSKAGKVREPSGEKDSNTEGGKDSAEVDAGGDDERAGGGGVKFAAKSEDVQQQEKLQVPAFLRNQEYIFEVKSTFGWTDRKVQGWNIRHLHSVTDDGYEQQHDSPALLPPSGNYIVSPLAQANVSLGKDLGVSEGSSCLAAGTEVLARCVQVSQSTESDGESGNDSNDSNSSGELEDGHSESPSKYSASLLHGQWRLGHVYRAVSSGEVDLPQSGNDTAYQYDVILNDGRRVSVGRAQLRTTLQRQECLDELFLRMRTKMNRNAQRNIQRGQRRQGRGATGESQARSERWVTAEQMFAAIDEDDSGSLTVKEFGDFMRHELG